MIIGVGIYSVVAELGHDCFHRLLIFFEKNVQLSVFLQECVVFDDDLSVQAFEF